MFPSFFLLFITNVRGVGQYEWLKLRVLFHYAVFI